MTFNDFISFSQEYFICLLGAPIQLLGILAAFALRGKRMASICLMLLSGSLLILLSLLTICVITYLNSFTEWTLFGLDLDEDTMLVTFGVWLTGMAIQLVGTLLLALRLKHNLERFSTLEKIADSPPK